MKKPEVKHKPLIKGQTIQKRCNNTNIDLQNTTEKTPVWETSTPLIAEVDLRRSTKINSCFSTSGIATN